MSIQFFNRELELTQLKEALDMDEAVLMIMYGERQVGKSEILSQINKELAGEKRIYYYQFTEHEPKHQLVEIQKELRAFLGDSSLLFQTWEQLFDFTMQRRNIIWFFDELPYLIKKDDSIPTVLQKTWDKYKKNSQTKLLLCGSYVSVMENIIRILSHGRVTKTFRIEPMNFLQARLFLPEASFEHQLILYAIFGGIPSHLNRIRKLSIQPIEEILLKVVFSRDSPYQEAVPNILRSQVRDPARYLGILWAIARGNHTYSAIEKAARMKGKNLPHFMEMLIGLNAVKRTMPFLGGKKQFYHISDPFTRFWHLFYKKVLSPELYVRNVVMPNLSSRFLGYRFEEICRELLRLLSIQGKCTDIFEEVYSFNGEDRQKKSFQVDIIAVGQTQQTLLLGECKWEDTPPHIQELNYFKRKATNFLEIADDYEFPINAFGSIKFVFFSRGETQVEKKLPPRIQDIQLVSLNELERWAELPENPRVKII